MGIITTDLELVAQGHVLPPDSELYVVRSPQETDCLTAALRPGALVRIKGVQQMGKSSLIRRLLHQATVQNYPIASLSLNAIAPADLQDLDRLLQWMAVQVGTALQLPDRRLDYWDDLFGSTISCKSYFEEYLLAQVPALVLALDDVDRLFAYPALADEFFGLLRAWHEESKNRPIWQKLRLIVAHAMEVYIPLNLNKSPFNVGIPLELTPFTAAQIDTLAQRYGLSWSEADSQLLLSWVGGHPYLVQLTLQTLHRSSRSASPLSLSDLLPISASHPPLYLPHLDRQWHRLIQDPPLLEALAQILDSPDSGSFLDPAHLITLRSLGLVVPSDARLQSSCKLYTHYFRDRLRLSMLT